MSCSLDICCIELSGVVLGDVGGYVRGNLLRKLPIGIIGRNTMLILPHIPRVQWVGYPGTHKQPIIINIPHFQLRVIPLSLDPETPASGLLLRQNFQISLSEVPSTVIRCNVLDSQVISNKFTGRLHANRVGGWQYVHRVEWIYCSLCLESHCSWLGTLDIVCS